MRKILEVKPQQQTKSQKAKWRSSDNQNLSIGDKGHVSFEDPKDPQKTINKVLYIDKVLSEEEKIVCHEVIVNDEGRKHVPYLLSKDRFSKIDLSEERRKTQKVLRRHDAELEIAKLQRDRSPIGLRDGFVYEDIMNNIVIVDSDIAEPIISYKEISKDV